MTRDDIRYLFGLWLERTDIDPDELVIRHEKPGKHSVFYHDKLLCFYFTQGRRVRIVDGPTYRTGAAETGPHIIGEALAKRAKN